MGCSHNRYQLRVILILLSTVLLTTDGSLTWYEPLPIQTLPEVANPGVHRPNSTRLLEGSINASLSWNFSLSSDVSFSTLNLFFDNAAIVGADASGYRVLSGFEARFGFIWIPSQRATLIIFNVTTAENGVYICRVGGKKNFITYSWSSEVQGNVVSPPKITFISSNQTKNESDQVTLICNATGKPQPDITWTRLRDEREVTFNITGEQDKGVYTCTYNNDVGNPDSKDVYITVVNFHPVDTNLSTSLSDMTVVVNTSFNLICSARANPLAKYRLYREQESLFNTTAGQDSVTYATKVTERISQVNYSCTPFNFYGDGLTKTKTVTVHYHPEIVTSPLSQQVIERGNATLFCNATGNPQPNITWTKDESSTILSASQTLTLTSIRRGDNQAVYKCTVKNYLGSRDASAMITVLYPPSVAIRPQCPASVVDGGDLTLNCSASGNPEPSIAWIKGSTGDVVSYNASLVFEAIQRNESDCYDCLAWNGIGSNSSVPCAVDVQFPPVIKSPQRGAVQKMEWLSNFTVKCQADANPPANYSWENPTGVVVSSNADLNIPKANFSDDGDYSCTARNELGSASVTTSLNTANDTFRGAMTLQTKFPPECEDQDSSACKEFIKPWIDAMDKRYENVSSYNRTEPTGVGNGSVIVSFILIFNTPVTTNEAFAKLREAVNNGTLGPFKVGNLKIFLVAPATTPTAAPTDESTKPAKPTTKATAESKGPALWVIIVAVVGGVALLAFFIGLVTWCVYNKRKCKKDTKIHHSDTDEEHALQEVDLQDNNYTQVNHGYARSGPPSANGADSAGGQQVGAVPTYAVVDKSTKKNKNKKEKEEKPPEYAVVDKSQKKKKKNDKVDDTYAEVDNSKKTSKKKPKPGEEVVYADLGDLDRPQMTPVVTSPKTLPPIKKPEPYQETQYADITQFMKGDAILPKDEKNEGAEIKPQEEKKDETEAENKPKETPM